MFFKGSASGGVPSTKYATGEMHASPATMCTNNWASPGCVIGSAALRVRTGDTLSESRMREGAADKTAIQLVGVQPCQLPMSDT